MPTEAKYFGVYGAVWLAIFVAGASARVCAADVPLDSHPRQGQKENRFDRLGLRLATFIKEVMFQTRFLHGEPIIRWRIP